MNSVKVRIMNINKYLKAVIGKSTYADSKKEFYTLTESVNREYI